MRSPHLAIPLALRSPLGVASALSILALTLGTAPPVGAGPTDPVLVTKLTDWCQRFEVVGSKLYCAHWERFFVLDISDPARPAEAGECSYRYEAEGLAIASGHAYISDGLVLTSIDLSGDPRLAGELWVDSPSGIVRKGSDVAAFGGRYLAFAAGETGLHVLDTAEPAVPLEVAHVAVPDASFERIVVQGNLAYVASVPLVDHFPVDDRIGLRIFDLSNPAAPVEMGSWETAGWSIAFAPQGDRLCVAVGDPRSDGASGLHVLDLSNPGAPAEVGFCEVPFSYVLGTMAAEGSWLYVADDDGIWVIDVADPAAPREVNLIAIDANVADLAVAGDFLFLSGEIAVFSFSGALAIPGLACALDGERIRATWSESQFSTVEIQVDGETVGIAEATGGQYSTESLPVGYHTLCATGFTETGEPGWKMCCEQVGVPSSLLFIRGDCNQDGEVDISDPICILSCVFFGFCFGVPCVLAYDANQDRQFNITDPIYILNYIFLGGPPIPAPYKECGHPDPSETLPCSGFKACP